MAQDTVFSTKSVLTLRGKIYNLDSPRVMGILNITPDSFYEKSRAMDIDSVLKRAEKMVKEGVDFLDVGGYSTRPGAEEVSEAEERNRTLPVLENLRKTFPEVYLSIDTFRSELARSAVDHGADLINDVSGGNLDPNMFTCISELEVPYILMHMRGTPDTMAQLNRYDNLLIEVVTSLQEKVIKLKELGVTDIIIDPGFGFAKSPDQNYELLKNLAYFKIMELPLLVGLSRKSMIYKKLGIKAVEALNGTTVLHTIALQQGARILRVHDVREAVEAIKLFKLTFG